jgi:hypothetical protein
VIIIFTKLLFGNFLIVKENLKSKEFTTKENGAIYDYSLNAVE